MGTRALSGIHPPDFFRTTRRRKRDVTAAPAITTVLWGQTSTGFVESMIQPK
jgi:hypothetical protein